ncbi:MAG: LOG family protein [Pseudomonadota bacterium]
MTEKRTSIFRSADQDAHEVEHVPDTPQTRAPAYRLAFEDNEFMRRERLRPVRLQLELLKPEMAMGDAGITSTIVLFGGSRIPDPVRRNEARTQTLADLADYYDEARKFAGLVGRECLSRDSKEFVVVTGGGPGVMEAGNRGAAEVGAPSVGLNIVLPHEQAPNGYVTPELCFNFHYFAIRKMHFLMRAAAIAVFPGGFGTLDELFETLTLIQTERMERVPVLLFGEAFWRSIVNWEALADAGTIAADDLNLFQFVETADQAWEIIRPKA